MTSRSANVLVIFIVAIFAFCFASVFASMTGSIAILPSNNDSDELSDNVTVIDENLTNNNNNYKAPTYTKQTDDSKDNSKDDDKSNVETTVDKSTTQEKTTTSTKDTSDSQSNENQIKDIPSDDVDVETTTEDT